MVAHLGRSGRVSGKHLGCDRLGLGRVEGRTSRQGPSRSGWTVERRMLGDVVQALASTIWSHKRTHTKETGEGEEREEESSGVK